MTELAAAPSTGAQMRAHAIALRSRLGTSAAGPIDVAAAARTLGCRVIERRDPSPHLQAALVPATEPGFIIWLLKRADDPTTSRDTPKDRFLVLHELAHTLFYSRQAAPHRRIAPPAEHEEFLCDVFAAEALVPHDGRAGDIDGLAEAYRAPEAIARWVRVASFSVGQWRRTVDRCTGPGW